MKIESIYVSFMLALLTAYIFCLVVKPIDRGLIMGLVTFVVLLATSEIADRMEKDKDEHQTRHNSKRTNRRH